MVNQKKVEFVQNLAEKLKKAKSFVLVDHSGLTVPQQEELRKKIKAGGGEFTVVKNSLLKLAFHNSQSASWRINDQLKGPTALMIAFEDELAPIKILVGFGEEFELLPIKAGFFEGQALEKETVIDLAKIPGRDQLIIQLTNLLNSPLQRLAQDLSADIRKLLFILKTKGSHSSDGGSPPVGGHDSSEVGRQRKGVNNEQR